MKIQRLSTLVAILFPISWKLKKLYMDRFISISYKIPRLYVK